MHCAPQCASAKFSFSESVENPSEWWQCQCQCNEKCSAGLAQLHHLDGLRSAQRNPAVPSYNLPVQQWKICNRYPLSVNDGYASFKLWKKSCLFKIRLKHKVKVYCSIETDTPISANAGCIAIVQSQADHSSDGHRSILVISKFQNISFSSSFWSHH